MTTNGGPTAANDADRLPWLEPYRDVTKAGVARPVATRSSPRRNGGLIVAGIGALLVAVGGGYWLGKLPDPSASRAPASVQPPGEQPIVVAQAPQAPSQTSATEVAEPVKPKPGAVTASAKKATVTKSAPVRVHRGASRRERLKRGPLENDQLASVLGKQGEVRTWPKMPSPGPAGQVIQLGAFSSPSRAERAYLARAGRYPLLATMPKVIVPVVTKPRGEILYVLRLGTQSREQSTVVCRNLRNSGDHCLVIG